MTATRHALKCPTCGGELEKEETPGLWWLRRAGRERRDALAGKLSEYARCSRCAEWFRRTHGSTEWKPLRWLA